MDDYVHFDGDPAVDSQRRHLERVIKGYPPRRRWAWIVAAVAGGGLWAAWRTAARGVDNGQARAAARSKDGTADPAEAPKSHAATGKRSERG